ncbi:TPA: tail fiber domain-containing protein [Escherichia coli]
MIYTTGTIAINGNTVKGTGTNFSEPLSLIRVGCTLIAVGNPVQIFTITEIKSGTELSVTPAANPTIAAGTKFSILLSDSISVDGLAQDVAETLRYYQGKETEIATAVEWWNEFLGDGQMEQLLADIRAETAQSTANAQKTESDKNEAEASKTAAANSATAAKASQDAAKASETAASNSKTAAATSETNAAKSAADALNYRNQAQGFVGTSIGLGSSPRDCPDISGDPSGYIGFMRIMEDATGFPSIASGDGNLTGFISQVDESPAYTGIFQGWNTRSIYTYRWSSGLGPQWSQHARKDEVSRLTQGSGESALWAAGGKQKFVLLDGGDGNTLSWGVWDNVASKWSPLSIAQGGTGAIDALTARNNLGVGVENSPQFRDMILSHTTDESSGWVSGGVQKLVLLGSEGTKRAEGLAYAECNPDQPTQLTFAIYGVNEGYNYLSFNTMGQILAETAIFRSNYANPLVIKSSTPTICFNEEGRPDGSPFYNLIFDDGNWRIQKNGDGYNGEYVIGYNYTLDEMELPNLLTKAIKLNSNDHEKSLLIRVEDSTKFSTLIKVNGNDTGRDSVFELDFLNEETTEYDNYGFYCQILTDNSIQFQVNGAVNCTTLNQSSDRDLKDNIQVIGDATEAIRKMSGYTYTLKENGLPYAGVIAQEVMEALPEAVGSFTHYGKWLQGPTVDGNELREETRYLNVDYAAVTGLLVQVARETDNRVTELEEENASLRDNIAAMDERIAKLEALVSQLTGSEK